MVEGNKFLDLFNRYNSSYKNNEGKSIKARVVVEKTTPTDTLLTMTPQGGTTHYIKLAGPKSTVTKFGGDIVGDTEVKGIEKNNWIKAGRQVYNNRSKNPILEQVVTDWWNGIKSAVGFKQQGGNISSEEDKLVQLVKAAMSGDKEAASYIEQIIQAAQQGNQEAMQLATAIQEIVKKLKGIKAKLGAKLNYLNIIKNGCPEGTEKVYLKSGGCMCKKKVVESKCGSKVKKNKCGSKMKK